MKLEEASEEVARRLGKSSRQPLKIVTPAEGSGLKQCDVLVVMVGLLKGNSRGELLLTSLKGNKRLRENESPGPDHGVLCLPQPAPLHAKDKAVAITKWTFVATSPCTGVYVIERASLVVLGEQSPPLVLVDRGVKPSHGLAISGHVTAISPVISGRSTRPSFLADVRVSPDAHVVVLWDGPSSTQCYPFLSKGIHITIDGLKVSSLPRCQGAKVLRFDANATISSTDEEPLHAVDSPTLHTLASTLMKEKLTSGRITSHTVSIEATVTNVYDDDFVELDGSIMLYFGSQFAGLAGIPRKKARLFFFERMSLAVSNATLICYGKEPRALYSTARSSLRVMSKQFGSRAVLPTKTKFLWSQVKSTCDIFGYLKRKDLDIAFQAKFPQLAPVDGQSFIGIDANQAAENPEKNPEPPGKKPNVFEQYLNPEDPKMNISTQITYFPTIKQLLCDVFSCISARVQEDRTQQGTVVHREDLQVAGGNIILVGRIQCDRHGSTLKFVDSTGGIRVRLQAWHQVDQFVDCVIASHNFYVVVQQSFRNPTLSQGRHECLLVVEDNDIPVLQKPSETEMDVIHNGTGSNPAIMLVVRTIRLDKQDETMKQATVSGLLCAVRPALKSWQRVTKPGDISLVFQDYAISRLVLLKPGVIAILRGPEVQAPFPCIVKCCSVSLISPDQDLVSKLGYTDDEIASFLSDYAMCPWTSILHVQLEDTKFGPRRAIEQRLSFRGVVIAAKESNYSNSKSISYCFKLQEQGVSWHSIDLFVDLHKARIPKDFFVGSLVQIWNCNRSCTKVGRIVCRASYDTLLCVIAPPEPRERSGSADFERLDETTLAFLWRKDVSSSVSTRCFGIFAEVTRFASLTLEVSKLDGVSRVRNVQADFYVNDGTAEALAIISDAAVLSCLLDIDFSQMCVESEEKISLSAQSFRPNLSDPLSPLARYLVQCSRKSSGPLAMVVKPRPGKECCSVQDYAIGKGKSFRTLVRKPDSALKLDCFRVERLTSQARALKLVGSMAL